MHIYLFQMTFIYKFSPEFIQFLNKESNLQMNKLFCSIFFYHNTGEYSWRVGQCFLILWAYLTSEQI